MIVSVTKSVNVDDDVAEEMMTDFADWLDEKGILNDKHGFKYNRDLVKTFLEEHE